MPTRMLRDWTDSEAVNKLDCQAEVFFTRLIMKVDDFGRFPANPKLLKSLMFPLKDGIRDADIARSLAACQGAGLLAIYQVGEKFFLEVLSFNQRLRIAQSKYPERVDAREVPAESLTNGGQMSGTCPPEEKGREMKRSESSSPPPAAAAEGGEFEKFWQAYPRKVGKLVAAKQWQILRPSLEQCLSAIEHQKGSEQWRKDGGQFIPYPATWLHQGRWEDAPKVELGRRPVAAAGATGNPEGWAEWVRENYPQADPRQPFHTVSPEIQREFHERKKV